MAQNRIITQVIPQMINIVESMCSLSNIFACRPISPITKNVGAILIQNEDLMHYRLPVLYESHYHTLSDTISI